MYSYETYFEFLRYCLDDHASLPAHAHDMDWNAFYGFCKEQAILATVFSGMEKVGNQLTVDVDLLMAWCGKKETIARMNKELNPLLEEVVSQLMEREVRCCVLKGQGNALLYPQPLTRMPGDFDLWVREPAREVIGWARKKNRKNKVCYHHVEFGVYKGAEIELHYRPSFQNNLIYNHRLQQWFKENAPAQFAHEVCLPSGGMVAVPTPEFNVVYLLAHISNHLMNEGIGLRQFIDYYYLLKNGRPEEWRAWADGTLRRLGLRKVAGAAMYVLHEALGLDERYLIVPMDKKRGAVLLQEILQGGNFGAFDSRVKRGGFLRKNLNRLQRDGRLLRYFPSEALWEPVFRVYHFFWRLAHR